MGVKLKHPHYQSSITNWQKTRAASSGCAAIKAAGTLYLPQPQADDSSDANLQRYFEYKQRALYVNFTGMTGDGMLGMAFRNDPIIELPAAIGYLAENANGEGLPLIQLAKRLTDDILKTGRYGLLVDYPQAKDGLTRAQADSLQANIKCYPAEAITNWRTSVDAGQTILSLVVLKETVDASEGFDTQESVQYRALILEEGVYIQRLYDENDNQIGPDIIPRGTTGATWSEIPFVFVCSVHNDSEVDKAPLSDIADENIAHYINSADNEESSFMVGQPTAYATGLNQLWIDEVLGGEIRLGSRSFIPLPEGGSAGLIQATANTMPRQGMIDKEAQLIKIGARLITDTTGQETAEAARIRFAGQNSQLGTVVGNIEAGIITAIGYAIEFMGGGDDFIFKLNRDFYSSSIDPQLVMAQIQLLDRGIIAKSDLRGNLRASRIIDSARTDEDIDGEAEALI